MDTTHLISFYVALIGLFVIATSYIVHRHQLRMPRLATETPNTMSRLAVNPILFPVGWEVEFKDEEEVESKSEEKATTTTSDVNDFIDEWLAPATPKAQQAVPADAWQNDMPSQSNELLDWLFGDAPSVTNLQHECGELLMTWVNGEWNEMQQTETRTANPRYVPQSRPVVERTYFTAASNMQSKSDAYQSLFHSMMEKAKNVKVNRCANAA